MHPRTLIVRTAGTNCDVETAFAFECVGATAQFLHLNRLIEDPACLQNFDILAFPGGFSYGDDIAAGRIFANQLRHHLRDDLRKFVASGKPIIGICNGFQVLVQTDLLSGKLALPDAPSPCACTLAHNDSGRFIDRWVHLRAVGGPCIWTAGLTTLELPIAHGEGKFMAANAAVLGMLHRQGQVALVYANPDGSPAIGDSPHNPNGSVDAIAGICDETGLVFGLMPHPERHIDPLQHPAWTLRRKNGEGDGLAIFRNAVVHAAAVRG